MTASDTTSDQRDPAEIEREIRHTQEEMSRTVDQLGDKLTARNLLGGLLDKADAKGVDPQYLIDTARRNPLALAMVAIGGIWLVSGSDARLSSLKPSGRAGGSNPGFGGSSAWDDHHRGYVEHMSRVERLPEEDDAAFRRRRDLARSNYLMIEQGHDEDESGFRKRLDEATEALRQRRHDLMEKAGEWGSSARDTAGSAVGKTGQLYDSNPLVGGVVAALLGALAGAAAPITRTEEEQLGQLGARALDAASEKASELGDIAREKKDELVEKADQALKPAVDDQGSGGQPKAESTTAQQPAPAI